MRRLLLLSGSVMAILIYLLATASGNTAMFGQYYWWLLGLNALLGLGIFGLVLVQLINLRRKIRARVFGSKLAWRMMLMFALVAVLPGALVYTLSVQFLGRSIETWFDVRVDAALDRGLNLGHKALENSLKDLQKRAVFIGNDLVDDGREQAQLKLESLRPELEGGELSLYDHQGRVIAHSGTNPAPALPDDVRKRMSHHEFIREFVSPPGLGLSLKVVVPMGDGDGLRILHLVQPVPKQLAEDAETVEQVRNDYKQLSHSRNGLKLIYTLTLTLALLIALLGALVLGMFLSERISAPLGLLAAGTRAVAQGDFTQRQPVMSRDELGVLTHSFNRMTEQLAEARDSVELNRREMAASKIYLETVLGSISSGVLTFDGQLRLRSGNSSAADILQMDFSRLKSLFLGDWPDLFPGLEEFALAVGDAFASSDNAWQQQTECVLAGVPRVLLMRGARLSTKAEIGFVVVFDDITELIQAQRYATWGEVAKRLAHEIRNPLTPIQLAAERMEMKLADKLQPTDADVLSRGVQTIVKQVAALKQMVDAFREYARQPKIYLKPLDLRQLLQEVLGLYEASPVTWEDYAPEGLLIDGDATLLRQVVHNLLQNAQDATQSQPDARIRVVTEVNGRTARLTIEDNGEGFSEAMMRRAFEPYATSKQKGTGLGLAIVKKIVDEHHGQITLTNREPQGALVRVEIPLRENVGG